MQQCVKKLQPGHREMLEKRYAEDGSVAKLAKAMNRSAASISQTLYRIRVALLQCIQKALSSDHIPGEGNR
jgi:DNA-directed RNA polymerase specialized sigma24 family protein